jgi:nitroimidazol reductase NimA-like FMN-containing flavoprotein (pyridoxamine 5'-phosphate oxidase superfamily)
MASMDIDRNGLDVLSREECLDLLRRSRIGRVGLSVDALPAVLPVNFAVVGEDVVFRTNSGAKLDAALANNVVAFEADGIDPTYHTGWSVLVQGMAREIIEPEQVEKVRKAPLRAWAGDGRDRFVRIPTQRLSGRRIRPPAGAERGAAPSTAGRSA